ncbi:demethylmenaquinone methyltransferase [Motilibacter deserti]|uniref:Demethylmenaquinone methyltransferase n=1 Tax=Motilibacter deserti TaxID=2714956 RepID=A0ABX0GZ18_9ACTN|nr:demethylmenaquinone methyltransferase [Motilibacter deserti]
MSRADLDKDPHDVSAMFDDVAPRYDLANGVLSLGQDRLWRRAVLRAVDPRPRDRVLDLAAGTGTSSLPFAAAGAQVVAADFSLGMLRAGHAKRSSTPGLAFAAADALHLPFADGAFDAVTISFGLRNVSDTDLALRELLRVTRPGGRLVVCEFSTPTFRPFRTVYSGYLMRALPRVARRVGTNGPAYAYLAESISAWPGQEDLARRVAGAGWQDVEWRDLTGGIVALHRGRKPLG